MSMNDQQLHWAQTNRSHPRRRRAPVGVGEIAAQVLGSPGLSGPAWRRRLISLIEERTGPAFTQCASIHSVRGGVLTVRAAEAALVYHLRLTWEQPILQLLQRELPEAGIHTVRFAAGPGVDNRPGDGDRKHP